jgi:hypothetical protein
LPAGVRFVNVQQVWEALGGDRERRDAGARVAPDIDDVVVTVEPESFNEPAPAEAWWLPPVRAGLRLATLPLRLGANVLRSVNDRIRR